LESNNENTIQPDHKEKGHHLVTGPAKKQRTDFAQGVPKRRKGKHSSKVDHATRR